MSSSGTPTSTLGLNQWFPNDKPERADFDSDNLKIDAAFNAIKQDVSAVRSTVNSTASAVATAQTTANGKVSKTGDTLTGVLSIKTDNAVSRQVVSGEVVYLQAGITDGAGTVTNNAGTVCISGYCAAVANNINLLANTVHTRTVLPSADNLYNLGSASYRFANTYFGSSPTVSSDENMKEDIDVINDAYLNFLMSLNPVIYKFKDDENNKYLRMHCGLIAQGVERALYENGLNTLDFAGLIISPITEEIENGEYTEETIVDENGEEQTVRMPITETIITGSRYGLRYEEFIAPMLKMLQNQQKTIENLTARIEALDVK